MCWACSGRTVACGTNASGKSLSTGRIGTWQHLMGGVSWGCPGGAQRTCGDHIHPIQLGFHGNPKVRKNGHFFPMCMWIYGELAPCDPSALLATKRASLRIKTCRLALSLIMEKRLRIYSKSNLFCSQKKRFYGSKSGVLGYFGSSARWQTQNKDRQQSKWAIAGITHR